MPLAIPLSLRADRETGRLSILARAGTKSWSPLALLQPRRAQKRPTGTVQPSQNLCRAWHFCWLCLQGILSVFIDWLFVLQQHFGCEPSGHVHQGLYKNRTERQPLIQRSSQSQSETRNSKQCHGKGRRGQYY